MRQQHGWLTPQGRFHPCVRWGHQALADLLGVGSHETKYWAKVTGGRWLWVKPLSEAQQDFIAEWYHEQGLALDVGLEEPVAFSPEPEAMMFQAYA